MSGLQSRQAPRREAFNRTPSPDNEGITTASITVGPFADNAISPPPERIGGAEPSAGTPKWCTGARDILRLQFGAIERNWPDLFTLMSAERSRRHDDRQRDAQSLGRDLAAGHLEAAVADETAAGRSGRASWPRSRREPAHRRPAVGDLKVLGA
jgi:hypothetical protein